MCLYNVYLTKIFKENDDLQMTIICGFGQIVISYNQFSAIKMESVG